ncbi:hypothetical protein [uncultured Meiothermus sp.]|nr:hypothetical protein [uncultured Meiothermus sp.]
MYRSTLCPCCVRSERFTHHSPDPVGLRLEQGGFDPAYQRTQRFNWAIRS